MELLIKYGVDIALIAVFVICVVTSMKKGFLQGILSLACVIISFAAATSLSGPIAEWCYDTFLDGMVAAKVEEAMLDGFKSIDETVSQAIPQFLLESVSQLGIDIGTVTESIESLGLSTHDTAQKISVQIIRPVAVVILRIFAYMVIFAFVRFLTGVIAKALSRIANLPFLKEVNKWFGAALGVIKGLILIFSVCMVFNLCSDVMKNTDVFVEAIENSNICGIIGNVDFSALVAVNDKN